jgi:hypothetical protein
MAVCGFFFMLPMYLTNVWNTGYLPFNTNKLYDRYGKRFIPSKLLDDRANFDLEKYKNYSVSELLGITNFAAHIWDGSIRDQIRVVLRCVYSKHNPRVSLSSYTNLDWFEGNVR